MNQREQGIYNKFNVTRTDGTDAPGGKHEGNEYFVLNLTTDKHGIPAIAAYAESCAAEYPLLASDLRAKVAATVKANCRSLFITVPEVTLPSGIVVPSFQYGQFVCGKGADGKAVITEDGTPWVRISFEEAKAACADIGGQLVTETQALAIAHNVAQQDCNWTKGKVGEGKLFRGLRKGNVSSAQTGTFQSPDAKERRWLTLSNGEKVCDLNGNVFSWVFDDVQGDENGLTGKIAADSISLTTAPYPSEEKGMGWRPDRERDWSGYALVRGGCWSSGSRAGVFSLGGGYPDYRNDGIGFRCTKGL